VSEAQKFTKYKIEEKIGQLLEKIRGFRIVYFLFFQGDGKNTMPMPLLQCKF
jgi:hypothetical protein